ncbi:MlaD family protein [Desulfonatronum thioautotrophicum]|uniref:MlaD family protein n=1 Tax=Desulfonatronum thioautotrophicum TaxID=617001 RepID=UPI0005EB4B5C|nr:MlaD family protein [Desulfonatronum thioautotrophicum]
MSLNQRTLELKVGLFVLTVLAGVAFLIVYIGIQKDLFAERISYTVVSQTGERIEPGMPVRLSGFNIGQVTDVSLDRVDQVRMTIRILKRYQQWFTADTRIILEQEGFIGRSFLKLMPGTEAAPILEEGAVIRLDKIGGINELIQEMQPVIEAMRAIVINIWDLTDYLVDDQGPVRRILVNAETMTERLLAEQGLVYYLTEDPRPTAHIDEILAKADTAMLTVNRLLESTALRIEDLAPVQEEIAGVIREVNTLIVEFQGVRDDISPLLGNLTIITEDAQPLLRNVTLISEDIQAATHDLISLRRQGEYSLRLGTDLMLRLQETWPLSRRERPGPEPSFPWP